MRVYPFPLGPLQTNCYLVCNEKTNEAILIDAGANPKWILAQASAFQIKAILLTHAHYDHIAGLNEIREATKAPVYIHGSEQEWLGNPELNRSGLWSSELGPVICEKAEFELRDEQLLNLAGFQIYVIHTPGHSPGGTSFLIDLYLFSGDALFARTIGKTGMPSSDFEQLMTSILDKLIVLPDATVCYPGHGTPSTIGRIKVENRFILDYM